jgi:CHAT domain-containing protein
MSGDVDELLKSLKTGYYRETEASCPENVDWLSVAAGLLPPAQAFALIGHASRCSRCGWLLKAAADHLADEASSEEEAILAALESSSELWQDKMGKALRDCAASPRVKPRRPPPLRPWFLLPVAAALVLVAGTVTTLRHFRSLSAQALIADAYAEHRTLELRLPGAGNAPMRLERGSGSSSIDRPSALLKAESLIGDGLRMHPNDVALLDAKARADLLDGNFQPAIEALSRALETDPKAGPALLDLGTAYFLRGEAEGDDEQDYALAIEYQGRALAESPNDTVALFNRAIAEEKAYLYDRAETDWKRFLTTEKDPAWRAEGQRRYEALVQKLRKTDKSGNSLAAPVQDPAQAARLLDSHARQLNDTDWPPALDEAYLKLALTDWLAAIVSPVGGVNRPSPETWNALHALAETLDQRHDDSWLSELLAGEHSQPWRDGIRELSAAARANEQGDLPGLIQHARQSLRSFQQAANKAGEAGADFELTRGLAQSQRGDQCRPAALEGLGATRGHRYPWVTIGISYELSTCLLLRGDPEQAMRVAGRAETMAQGSGYAVLALHGRFYLDGLSVRQVALSESWNRIRTGLRDYWQSSYPPLEAAGFYTDLGIIASMGQEWRFAEDAWQEAVLMYSRERDREKLAASHAALARVALAAGDAQLADAEFQEAGDTLGPWRKDAGAALATIELQRASLEVRQGRLASAAARLDDVKRNLASIKDQSTTTLYRESLGELYLRSGKPKLAEQELWNAVRLIEMDKNSLSSETDFLAWQLNTSQAYRMLMEIYSLQYHADARSLALLEWFQAEPLRIDPGYASALAGHPLGRHIFPVSSEADYQKDLVALSLGTPILAWASFPSELVIWELDKDGVHSARVAVPATLLSGTAVRFARLCADPNSDMQALHRDARQLYDWLIQPIADRLPTSGALNVEPGVALHLIPFQVLQGSDGRYLGERFSVSESAGLLYSRIRRPDAEVSSRRFALAVGDPQPGPGFSRLPEAVEEAQDAAAHFSEHVLLTGSQATLARVVSLLPRVEVFHFAGHALVQGQGHEPGLLLASDADGANEMVFLGQNRLRPHDLRKLQLVVLSGCDTAAADQGMVDPGSLVRIFLRSGAPHVIASKWRVDSRVSSEIMRQFYSRVSQGHPVASALADSERSIRDNPETSHPYYWGAFTAFGN